MSSLRNAVKRKTHKERSQPEARKRFGFLEKHKDYAQRAQDYNKKQKRLSVMKDKAMFKNPDEFYQAMQTSGMKGGVHKIVADPGKSLDIEQAKIFKTQDLNYVSLKRASGLKKIDQLESSLHFIDLPKQNSHTIFLDSNEDLDTFDPAEHFETHPALLDRKSNRIRMSDLESAVLAGPQDPQTLQKLEKQRASAYRNLSERQERDEKLKGAALELQLQRNLMGKGKKRKVEEAKKGQPAVYKWKTQRKK